MARLDRLPDLIYIFTQSLNAAIVQGHWQQLHPRCLMLCQDRKVQLDRQIDCLSHLLHRGTIEEKLVSGFFGLLIFPFRSAGFEIDHVQ